MRIYVIIAFVTFLLIGGYFAVKAIKETGKTETERDNLKVTNEVQNKINSVGNISYNHKLLVNGLRNAKSNW